MITSSAPFAVQYVLPEIVVAAASVVLLMLGVFRKSESGPMICRLSALVLLGSMAWVCLMPGWTTTNLSFGGLFVDDAFARFAKLLTLAGAVIVLFLAQSWLSRESDLHFEFPVLVLFGVVGMMIMISANDLMSVYMGVELQSFVLYILAAYRKSSLKSTEAGMKYFVLGALSSAVMLYGMSLVYGFSGTTRFEGLVQVAQSGAPIAGVIVGLVFIVAGLAFKVSAVPFHMWTPDVYEGAPTPVTAFFSIAPKIAALALFARVMLDPFGGYSEQWVQILWLISALSMLVGAFAAIAQTNIKRMMAYSSIGHVGYALIGITAGGQEGMSGMLIYLAIYLVMNLGVFALILAMRRNGQPVEKISDLAGFSRSAPMTAAAIALLMFSMAGIPPLAGFFGKFYIFMSAINAHLYWLAIIGVFSSVVSAFYYLHIIKVMYFDETTDALEPIGVGVNVGVIYGCTFLVTFFFMVPGLLAGPAGFAAKALFATP